MALLRDMPITIKAMTDTVFVTCSALVSTAASTSPNQGFVATADALAAATTAGTTGFGFIIDRGSAPLGTLYNGVSLAAMYQATLGSTEADRQFQIGIRLQHGSSSGGADMADYSTGSTPSNRTFFGTGRTTDMLNWNTCGVSSGLLGLSTGILQAGVNPNFYDISGAKQYLRIAVTIAKDRVTTETSGDERGHLSAAMTFLAAADIPQVADGGKYSPFSTTTSTA